MPTTGATRPPGVEPFDTAFPNPTTAPSAVVSQAPSPFGVGAKPTTGDDIAVLGLENVAASPNGIRPWSLKLPPVSATPGRGGDGGPPLLASAGSMNPKVRALATAPAVVIVIRTATATTASARSRRAARRITAPR